MLLLLALSASAQPAFYGGNGPYYGAGTPGPYYGARAFGGPYGNARQVSQNQWDLYQADRTVRASYLDARGHNIFYNVGLDTLLPGSGLGANDGLLSFGAFSKASGAQLDEQRIQDEIDRYRFLHPRLTLEDRDYLDDLILQRESARNQKLRRAVQSVPFLNSGAIFPGAPGQVPAYFERRANEKDLQLAENAYYDARRDVAKDPSYDNIVQLRNARDDIDQADARRDANTFDLLGDSFDGASRIAPLLRKQASSTKLDIGYRSLRLAQQEYAKNPTEINRMNVQLANLFIDATSQEDSGNKNDLLAATLLGNSGQTEIYNAILGAKNFQDESNLWLRYDRLKRKILIRQQIADAQGKATSEGDSVANQMLGMSMYGPPAGGNPRTGGGNPR